VPINAISIVDRYLEHSRIFYFKNGGDAKVFVSSADWMVRNLDHRIETAFEIEHQSLKQEILDLLYIELSENVKARLLDNRQRNQYVVSSEEPFRAQEERYYYLLSKNNNTP
jgi:polyphosphate kinase